MARVLCAMALALALAAVWGAAADVRAAAAGAEEAARRPDLRVSLRAGFTQPKRAHEAAEFAFSTAGGSTSAFLACGRALSTSAADPGKADTAVDLACGNSELRELALGLRVFAPAVEAQRQMGRTAADGCQALHEEFYGGKKSASAGEHAVFHFSSQGHGAVVRFDHHRDTTTGTTTTFEDVAAAARSVGSGGTEACAMEGFVNELDHIVDGAAFVEDADFEQMTVGVVYADIESPSFAAALDVAEKLLADGVVHRLAFRHFTPGDMGDVTAPGAKPMSIPGYGVELALKKLEYRTVDERAAQAAAASDTEEELPSEVDGFHFDVLKQRAPESAARLDAFRAHLMATEVALEDLKVWDLKELDFLAAQRVISAKEAGGDGLAALAEVSQNIPLLAPRIVRQRVNQTLKQVHQQAAKFTKLKAGTNMANLNGRDINLDSTDIFELFNVISDEVTKFQGLRNLRIPAAAASKLVDQGEAADAGASSTVHGMSAARLRKLANTGSALSGGGPTPSRFDIRADNIFWINNFDHDEQYAQWSKSVQTIFQRVWPGSFRQVARDFFTNVGIGDPSDSQFLQMVMICHRAIQQSIPVRYGLWLITEDLSALYGRYAAVNPSGDASGDLLSVIDRDSVGFKIAKLMWYLSEVEKDRDAANAFLLGLAQSGLMMQGTSITFDGVVAESFAEAREDLPAAQEVVDRDDLVEIERIIAGQTLRAFEVFGLDTKFPIAFMNGQQCQGESGGMMIQACVQVTMEQTTGLQMRVRGKVIEQSTADIYAQLVDPAQNDDVYGRFNENLLPDEHSNPLKFVALSSEEAKESLGIAESTDSLSVSWISHPRYRDDAKAVSVIVAADLNGPEGAAVAKESFRVLQHVPTDPDALVADDEDVKRTRIAFLHTGGESILANAIDAIMATQMSRRAFDLVGALLARNAELVRDGKTFDAIELDAALAQHDGTKVDKIKDAMKSISASRPPLRRSAFTMLGVSAGDASLFINGRVIVVHKQRSGESSLFTAPDVKFLVQHERRERGDRVVGLLSGNGADTVHFEGVALDDMTADVVSGVTMAACSLLGKASESGVAATSPPPGLEEPGVVSLEIGERDAPVQIVAVLDPVSKATQRLTPILHSLSSFLPGILRVRVVLSPRALSELPVKSFYRYVVPVAGEAEISATFDRLPPERLLTTNLDEPRSWLVSASSVTPAFTDLDNLQISNIHDHWRAQGTEQQGVDAVFSLDHILVEGHCYDVSNIHESGVPHPAPPTGLEIVLKPDVRDEAAGQQRPPDTMVMSNLGYYQLKANPGAYRVALKSGTRSEQLYRITSASDPRVFLSEEDGGSAEDAGAEYDEPFNHVVVRTFAPARQVLYVRKHPDHKGEALLQESSSGDANVVDAGGFFGYGGATGSADDTVNADPGNETVHVFSLATGKLYERFLGIMMLSVVKNTQNPVKFWFLANFLSPEFKEQAPVMAKKYGFELELVTYKWPDWLNAQTEKQRIIWGYKILFMDVMFPLDVKKIVYVDADQVVRGDLHELWEMDLGTAPYAYTPFCLPPNDNKDTTGFRFWASGFWKSHLGQMPYHISALYYVDLERFRQMGAGDTLRSTYHSLSQDPGSLSNLDQDLPNYLQRQVPIHSLPQEWLWCETWCSNGIKPRAKTIDLCNNPLTKMPKLEAARTIIPEWEDLDRESQAALRGE